MSPGRDIPFSGFYQTCISFSEIGLSHYPENYLMLVVMLVTS